MWCFEWLHIDIALAKGGDCPSVYLANDFLNLIPFLLPELLNFDFVYK